MYYILLPKQKISLLFRNAFMKQALNEKKKKTLDI